MQQKCCDSCLVPIAAIGMITNGTHQSLLFSHKQEMVLVSVWLEGKRSLAVMET